MNTPELHDHHTPACKSESPHWPRLCFTREPSLPTETCAICEAAAPLYLNVRVASGPLCDDCARNNAPRLQHLLDLLRLMRDDDQGSTESALYELVNWMEWTW